MRPESLLRALRGQAARALRGYAGIVLAESPWAGALVLGASLVRPAQGAWGLASGLLAAGAAGLLGLPAAGTGFYACNGALVGLFLAATGAATPFLLAFGCLASVALGAVLLDLFWRWDRLPPLSLPFALAACLLMAGRALKGGPAEAGFLPALGGVVCAPTTLAGGLVLAALLLSSRILALLAFGGYLLSQVLGGLPPALAFNACLAAMALGGVFLAPSWAGLAAAAVGVLGALGLHQALRGAGLPVLALPFLGATTAVLAVLRRRVSGPALPLAIDAPALPERNLERRRLALARCLEPDSVPLRAPFFGEWRVYQGFDGPHTHREAWRHALDFYVHDGRASHVGEGARLEDYHAFGLPVLAPCDGVLVDGRDDLPDNPPGEVDAERNWGNYALVRMASGLHVLLAHLRQGSLGVTLGSPVAAGQVLAACGSSGRSPQPHLHLHVQAGVRLGDPTHPFHLAAVQVRGAVLGPRAFALHARPAEGAWVGAAGAGDTLAPAFLLPPQVRLVYRVRGPRGPEQRALLVEQALDGRFFLHSDRGATAAFQRTDAVFACFDRTGARDEFFDLWLLAFGFTPLSPQAAAWEDRPDARLLPASALRRGLSALSGLDLLGLRSRYRRVRHPAGGFLQRGRHRLPGGAAAVTRAWIRPEAGPERLEAWSPRGRWRAELVALLEDPHPAETHPFVPEVSA